MPENPILIIVDTNILVSAILKDRVPEKVISFIVANDNFLWIASEEIVKEYKAVLIRLFHYRRSGFFGSQRSHAYKNHFRG